MLTPTRVPPVGWTRSFGRARDEYLAFAIHPDNRRLVAADRNGDVTVWDLGDGRRLQHLPANLAEWQLDDARNVDLQLHPDGVRVVVTVVIVDTSDVALCWNLDTDELVGSTDYPFVPDAFVGDHLAVTAHGLWLTLWDMRTSKPVRQLYRGDRSWPLLGMLDDDRALIDGVDTIEVWSLRSGQRTSSVPRPAACQVLASCGKMVMVRADGVVWRDATGELVKSRSCPNLTASLDEHSRLSLTGDERYAITWSDITAVGVVWELASDRCVMRASSKIAVSPDGTRAVIAEGHRLHLYPLDGRELTVAAAASRIASRVVVDEDDRSSIWVVDPVTAARLHRRTAPARIYSAAPCPAGRVVAATCDGGDVYLWRLDDDPATHTKLHARARFPAILAMEADARHLAIHSDETIELWRGPRGDEAPLRQHTFRHRTMPYRAVFDADRHWLISGHADGAVLIRDLIERRHHSTIEAHTAGVLAMALRGSRLASCGNDGAVVISDLDRGAVIARWSGDHDPFDVRWLDDSQLACETAAGILVLTVHEPA